LSKWPRVGPLTGETIIYITLVDFPVVNDQIPASSCLFPGYENSEEGLVKAVHINSTTVSCESVPLNISEKAIASGRMVNEHMYVTAVVAL
jgi:hypothetical protein